MRVCSPVRTCRPVSWLSRSLYVLRPASHCWLLMEKQNISPQRPFIYTLDVQPRWSLTSDNKVNSSTRQPCYQDALLSDVLRLWKICNASSEKKSSLTGDSRHWESCYWVKCISFTTHQMWPIFSRFQRNLIRDPVMNVTAQVSLTTEDFSMSTSTQDLTIRELIRTLSFCILAMATSGSIRWHTKKMITAQPLQADQGNGHPLTVTA